MQNKQISLETNLEEHLESRNTYKFIISNNILNIIYI
jgi:hypothetical protein